MRKSDVDSSKFKTFVRYLMQVAKSKRCATYQELQIVFGLGRGQIGTYAGTLGDLCIDWKWPRLNGLIIKQTDCVPSNGFDYYRKECGKTWGEVISECWKKFHGAVPKDFTGLDRDIQNFLGK